MDAVTDLDFFVREVIEKRVRGVEEQVQQISQLDPLLQRYSQGQIPSPLHLLILTGKT